VPRQEGKERAAFDSIYLYTNEKDDRETSALYEKDRLRPSMSRREEQGLSAACFLAQSARFLELTAGQWHFQRNHAKLRLLFSGTSFGYLTITGLAACHCSSGQFWHLDALRRSDYGEGHAEDGFAID